MDRGRTALVLSEVMTKSQSAVEKTSAKSLSSQWRVRILSMGLFSQPAAGGDPPGLLGGARFRLPASDSAALATSSRRWLCCSRPARVTTWKKELWPKCARVRRSSGWKSTMSASTQKDQKLSRIQLEP